jgi:diadenosine tetraphosphate (Ap4A) HIT family hydrolase
MISSEQAQKFKEQLLKQAESLPEENRKLVKHKILSMTDQYIEEFVKQNSEQSEEGETPNCIFCSIIDKKSFAYVIADTPKNLAILEINPLSKGHILILPKDHSDKEHDKDTVRLAEEIAEKIKTDLKPQKIDIFPSNLFGHSFMEIIPSYGEKLEKKKATKEELSELQEKLKFTSEPKKEIIEEKKEFKPAPEKVEKVEEKKPILPKLKRRIP